MAYINADSSIEGEYHWSPRKSWDHRSRSSLVHTRIRRQIDWHVVRESAVVLSGSCP